MLWEAVEHSGSGHQMLLTLTQWARFNSLLSHVRRSILLIFKMEFYQSCHSLSVVRAKKLKQFPVSVPAKSCQLMLKTGFAKWIFAWMEGDNSDQCVAALVDTWDFGTSTMTKRPTPPRKPWKLCKRNAERALLPRGFHHQLTTGKLFQKEFIQVG